MKCNIQQAILLSVIVGITFTLLVGHACNARFAGGEGLRPQGVAVNQHTGDEVERGEMMQTENAFAHFQLFGNDIFLAHNTQVVLLDAREGSLAIGLVQGRIVIDAPIEVRVREVNVQPNERMSVVHYSWQDELEIGAIDGNVTITTPKVLLHVDANQLIRIQTLAHYTHEYATFEPERSSERAFYEFAQ